MLTKHNWLTSNLKNRLIDPSTDFNVEMNPYPFKNVDFKTAVEEAAKDIASLYPKLYVALSGGMDSECVLRIFHRLNIPITPLIVVYDNKQEAIKAFEICNELSIEPEVIVLNVEGWKHYFYNIVHKKLNGMAPFSPYPLYAAEHAYKNGGVLITGHHLLRDGDILIFSSNYASSIEFEFYLDFLDTPGTNIDLLLWTPQVAYSSLPKDSDIGKYNWNQHKSKLYEIKYRNKISPAISNELKQFYQQCIDTHEFKPKYIKYWSKDEIDLIFNDTIVL